MIYSFDIYETLITRRFYDVKGIFFLMTNIMKKDLKYNQLNQYILDEFPFIRMMSEMHARNMLCREVSIKDIYDWMAINYEIKNELAYDMMQLEIRCEIDNVFLLEENNNRVMRLLSEGNRVILLSDSYFGKDIIKRILKKVNPVLAHLPIYISCDCLKTKKSGKLYQYVKEIEHITSYADWINVGSDNVSDESIPELLGIDVELFNSRCKTSNAERIIKCIKEDGLLRQYLLGLEKKSVLANKDQAYCLGYLFYGFILYSFVDWIIKQTLERKISYLYFVARDGYVLKKIADAIINQNKYHIRTNYLYGSRRAWRVENENERKMLKEYLFQELSMEDSNYALVDTQGTGKSIDCISKILNKKLMVFFYALFEPIGEKNITPIVYAPFSKIDMIEVLCRAPHGETVGYKRINDKIYPILDEANDSSVYGSIISYSDGVETFAKDFSSFCKTNKYHPTIFSLANEFMSLCCTDPDKQIADFIGEIIHDTNNSKEQNLYAPFLNLTDIKKIEYFRTTESLNKVYSGMNLDYSYQRLSSKDKESIKRFRKAYYKRQFKKRKNAVHVIIYGFGKSGRELYHRAYGCENVIVDCVVDVDYRRYRKCAIKVQPIKLLRKLSCNYIVISVGDFQLASEIIELLETAGICSNIILKKDEFIDKFLGV